VPVLFRVMAKVVNLVSVIDPALAVDQLLIDVERIAV
jgi:hypothetical protein